MVLPEPLLITVPSVMASELIVSVLLLKSKTPERLIVTLPASTIWLGLKEPASP